MYFIIQLTGSCDPDWKRPNVSSPETGGDVPVSESVLSPQAGMDAVTLRVGDLEAMSSYYAKALALEPLEELDRGSEVHRVLGRGATPMVKLVATPGLPDVDPRQAGLYHTAFLFEDQKSLAATVYRAAQEPSSRFVGSAFRSSSAAQIKAAARWNCWVVNSRSV